MSTDPGSVRLDKWLWHARFFKSRSLAAAACAGPMRLNGQPVAKPAQPVRAGDVLTFVQGRVVRVVRVLAPGTRRGPASEAQALYEDLSPPGATEPADPSAPRPEPGGRPTGRDRRRFDAGQSGAAG
ncbi:MAG: RNA-binding S4 domain-containing protein [Rhodobacter sp.]|uniref:RNA-binding S4 domain-containing protein n=1 Tax=Pararhodobacter sp. TaxID=2127056 RepID=UPI001DE4EE62|nr:RNA-binding S4 domain-containing protein [Pararhodobacter sp.]MCB1345721.1 RNA-binding S4 domain-containing protein [Paracoccaceae bacterium]MCC0073549.1 RNA-binding S4 domain-containing protein [Rhodobacter sp.]HPD92094.1 RNA-binding S4 domain-containing protein [Pararhodobacter sp.]